MFYQNTNRGLVAFQAVYLNFEHGHNDPQRNMRYGKSFIESTSVNNALEFCAIATYSAPQMIFLLPASCAWTSHHKQDIVVIGDGESPRDGYLEYGNE